MALVESDVCFPVGIQIVISDACFGIGRRRKIQPSMTDFVEIRVCLGFEVEIPAVGDVRFQKGIKVFVVNV